MRACGRSGLVHHDGVEYSLCSRYDVFSPQMFQAAQNHWYCKTLVKTDCEVQTLPYHFSRSMALKVRTLSNGHEAVLSHRSDKIAWINLIGKRWGWTPSFINSTWKHSFIQWPRILAKIPVASLQCEFFNAVHSFRYSSKRRICYHIPCNFLQS